MARFTFASKKRFGQNFLTNENIICQIVGAVSPSSLDHLVEIGPGQGAITGPLQPLCKQFDLIEFDKDLIPGLKARFVLCDNVTVHQADALSFPFDSLVESQEKLRIVGNLPYNISTPILFHLLHFKAHIQDIHVMLQKEVGLRITAEPGNKQYGRLSIFCQYFCDTELLFEVPPEAFNPKPKVDSCIIRLTPKTIITNPAKNLNLLQEITTAAFNQRRKTISNALKAYFTQEDFQKLHLNPSLRPENLSINDYVRLANLLFDRKA